MFVVVVAAELPSASEDVFEQRVFGACATSEVVPIVDHSDHMLDHCDAVRRRLSCYMTWCLNTSDSVLFAVVYKMPNDFYTISYSSLHYSLWV